MILTYTYAYSGHAVLSGTNSDHAWAVCTSFIAQFEPQTVLHRSPPAGFQHTRLARAEMSKRRIINQSVDLQVTQRLASPRRPVSHVVIMF